MDTTFHTAHTAPVTWTGGAARPGAKPAVVRWLGAFRDSRADLVAAAAWEVLAERERAAEPLWRGRTIMRRGFGVGLGYGPEAVRVVRSADCWSEPAVCGRLTLAVRRPRRAWRDWHAFSRVWSARRWAPDYHGEAWLRRGTQPVCVALARWAATPGDYRIRDRGWTTITPEAANTARQAAEDIAAALSLPIILIGHVDDAAAPLNLPVAMTVHMKENTM